MQEVISTQAAGCHALQGTVEQLVARIANKRRDRSGNGKVSVSQVCALTTKPSWDPEECGGNIWNESLDPEVESELALEGKEVAEAQTPPTHTRRGSRNKRMGECRSHILTPQKSLENFYRSMRRRVGKAYWHGFCKRGIVELHLSVD